MKVYFHRLGKVRTVLKQPTQGISIGIIWKSCHAVQDSRLK